MSIICLTITSKGFFTIITITTISNITTIILLIIPIDTPACMTSFYLPSSCTSKTNHTIPK
jgi:hypothetical protein